MTVSCVVAVEIILKDCSRSQTVMQPDRVWNSASDAATPMTVAFCKV